MAPTKKAQEQERVARIRANAAWGAQRSVDAPPKRISEVVEPETITTEVFTPVPAQHERGGPDLSPEAVLLYFIPYELQLIFFQYKHCQFCADFSMDLVPCVKCKKKVCIALKLGGSGCLLKETLPPEMIDSFECPQCHDGPMGVSIRNSCQHLNLIQSINRCGFKALHIRVKTRKCCGQLPSSLFLFTRQMMVIMPPVECSWMLNIIFAMHRTMYVNTQTHDHHLIFI